jgi:hypothetical protein
MGNEASPYAGPWRQTGTLRRSRAVRRSARRDRSASAGAVRTAAVHRDGSPNSPAGGPWATAGTGSAGRRSGWIGRATPDRSSGCEALTASPIVGPAQDQLRPRRRSLAASLLPVLRTRTHRSDVWCRRWPSLDHRSGHGMGSSVHSERGRTVRISGCLRRGHLETIAAWTASAPSLRR